MNSEQGMERSEVNAAFRDFMKSMAKREQREIAKKSKAVKK